MPSTWFICSFVHSHRPNSQEYQDVIPKIRAAVKDHLAHLKKGEPQLNWCDKAVMVGVYAGSMKHQKNLRDDLSKI